MELHTQRVDILSKAKLSLYLTHSTARFFAVGSSHSACIDASLFEKVVAMLPIPPVVERLGEMSELAEMVVVL